MFNLSEVPDRRWEPVAFPVRLDCGEVKQQGFEIQILVKTPDELQEMREKTIALIEDQLEAMRERAIAQITKTVDGKIVTPTSKQIEKALRKVRLKPSEGADVRMSRSLIVDWRLIEVDGPNDTTIPLPFNEENWIKVINSVEARVALVKKVTESCNREDLIKGN